MEIIKPGTRYDFIGKKKCALWISAAAILVSIGSLLFFGGLRYGVDFAGGVLVQIRFLNNLNIAELRSALGAAGMKDAMVQKFGGENEFLVRVEKSGEDMQEVSRSIQTALKERMKEKPFEIRRVEMVGPKIGKDLRERALWAVGLAFLGMLIYVSWRFKQVSYGLGGIVALIHDILVTFGALSISRTEFSLTVLAVILTIIGFSINDTIVIFDRVRENTKKIRKEKLETIFNISINETLGRTILTSSTVMMVVLILFFFGGAVIHDFAFALIVGLVSGTYSTIYIASPVVIFWERKVTARRRRR